VALIKRGFGSKSRVYVQICLLCGCNISVVCKTLPETLKSLEQELRSVHVLQVLDSPTHGTGCTLPDDIPGQVNSSGPHNFSFFSARQAAASAADTQSTNHPTWTNDNAATSGLQLPQQVPHANSASSSPSSYSSQSTVQLPAVPSCLTPQQGGASNGGPARWGLDMRGTEHKSKAMQAAGRAGKGPVNEVVCGAMMLAYERAGKWEQVSHCCPTAVCMCCSMLSGCTAKEQIVNVHF
jgi:hypothetical protein